MLLTNRYPISVCLFALSLFGLLSTGCHRAAAPVSTSVQHRPATASEKFVNAHNSFGWHLFAQVTAAQPHSNVFISPLGIATVLDMAYDGATGTTRQAMAQTLQLSNPSSAALNHENAKLWASLTTTEPGRSLSPKQDNPEFSMANALFARPGMALKPEFVQTARKDYHALVSQLSNDPAPINQWVKQQTHGKIVSIVGSQDMADTAVALVNAVYFKGAWAEAFTPQSTRQEPFHLADGSQQPCAMMHRSENILYQQGDHFQALSLPYNRSDIFMLILLPDETSSVATLIEHMVKTGDSNAWLQQFQEAHGEVGVPRFTLRWEGDLKAMLAALGMGKAFQPGSHFDNIAPDLYLSQVKHKTYLKVDEKGSEAAAATAGLGSLLSIVGPPPKPIRMIVDRPFLCAMVDTKTNAFLFLGAVYQPGNGGN